MFFIGAVLLFVIMLFLSGLIGGVLEYYILPYFGIFSNDNGTGFCIGFLLSCFILICFLTFTIYRDKTYLEKIEEDLKKNTDENLKRLEIKKKNAEIALIEKQLKTFNPNLYVKIPRSMFTNLTKAFKTNYICLKLLNINTLLITDGTTKAEMQIKQVSYPDEK